MQKFLTTMLLALTCLPAAHGADIHPIKSYTVDEAYKLGNVLREQRIRLTGVADIKNTTRGMLVTLFLADRKRVAYVPVKDNEITRKLDLGPDQVGSARVNLEAWFKGLRGTHADGYFFVLDDAVLLPLDAPKGEAFMLTPEEVIEQDRQLAREARARTPAGRREIAAQQERESRLRIERERMQLERDRMALDAQLERERRAENARMAAAGNPLTYAKYRQIRNGMNYEQVRDIIGVDGKEVMRGSVNDFQTIAYEWSNKKRGTMLVGFRNGRVAAKTERDLE